MCIRDSFQAIGVLTVRPVMAEGADPVAVGLARVAIAAVIFWATFPFDHSMKGKALFPRGRTMLLVVLNGLFGLGVGVALLLEALENGTVAMVTILSSTTPVTDDSPISHICDALISIGLPVSSNKASMITTAAIMRTRLKCSDPSSVAGRCENNAASIQLKAAPSARSADTSNAINIQCAAASKPETHPFILWWGYWREGLSTDYASRPRKKPAG